DSAGRLERAARPIGLYGASGHQAAARGLDEPQDVLVQPTFVRVRQPVRRARVDLERRVPDQFGRTQGSRGDGQAHPLVAAVEARSELGLSPWRIGRPGRPVPAAGQAICISDTADEWRPLRHHRPDGWSTLGTATHGRTIQFSLDLLSPRRPGHVRVARGGRMGQSEGRRGSARRAARPGYRARPHDPVVHRAVCRCVSPAAAAGPRRCRASSGHRGRSRCVWRPPVVTGRRGLRPRHGERAAVAGPYPDPIAPIDAFEVVEGTPTLRSDGTLRWEFVARCRTNLPPGTECHMEGDGRTVVEGTYSRAEGRVEIASRSYPASFE